jgi:hypothetical protein
MKDLSAEEVESNYNQFKKLTSLIETDNSVKLLKLIDDLNERLAL